MSKSWSDVVKLGKYSLKNRVVLSALTRVRCDPDGIPNSVLEQYYHQRAGAGLLLTESASISQRGIGFPGQGNLYTKEQAEGWRKVIKKVHQKGSILFAQIFHAGRVTHPKLNGGLQGWAPSALRTTEINKLLGGLQYPQPKAVTLQDIEVLKRQYDASFLLAKEAGFDGIELHGAFGYIIDEFLRTGANKRTDIYGGSAQNRARFPLQIIDIALKHFQPYQIGIKLSPVTRIQDNYDQNPLQTYTYFLQQLDKRNVGFVELAQAPNNEQIKEVCKTFRPHFSGLIIGNYGFNPQSGLKTITEGSCDLISFGRSYISHPDLAQRIIGGIQLDNKLDFTSLYWDHVRDRSIGYTDYPAYKPK